MAEVESVGGLVSVVAQRHVFSKGLLYNWRSAGDGARPSGPAGGIRSAWCRCIGPGPDDANDDWRDSPRVTGLALAVLDGLRGLDQAFPDAVPVHPLHTVRMEIGDGVDVLSRGSGLAASCSKK